MAYTVTVAFSTAGRSGRPLTRQYDLQNAAQVNELRRVRLPLMSDLGVRDLLDQVDAAPDYVRNLYSVQQLLIDLRRHLA